MPVQIDLSQFLDAADGTESVGMQDVLRSRWNENGIERIRDDFSSVGARCLFIRATQPDNTSIQVTLTGDYRLQSCPLGGWLLLSHDSEAIYWIPRLPSLRTLDEHERIMTETAVSLHDLDLTPQAASVTFKFPAMQSFDWVIWRFTGNSANWLSELETALTPELQAYFIYASHTTTQSPADLYLHLVHGHIYGNHWAWPKKRKICDELDAYALYLIMAGLGRSTCKILHTLLRKQVVVSVIDRQEIDGGFRHGEWTDLHETHNRLVNGAIHLLAAEAQLSRDPAVMHSLRAAGDYISHQIDRTKSGAWFLHDSLELSEETISHYPFNTVASNWLGKSRANLLILNTHMDCTIALDRYRQVTGDNRYTELVDSARAATRAALEARPADWLYRPLMHLIGLTLLPKKEQAALNLPLRILKRLTWKYLTPNWHRIKSIYPRFIMPCGFVDRSLGQEGYSHRYQSVHVMDLARYKRCFPSDNVDEVLNGAIQFTVQSHITKFWKENLDSRDSLGFWVEGLQQICASQMNEVCIARLAEAALDMLDAGIGLPPSVLGSNAEIVEPSKHMPCPAPTDDRLRTICLAHQLSWACVVLNPSEVELPLDFYANLPKNLVWQTATIKNVKSIPSRGWAWAHHIPPSPS